MKTIDIGNGQSVPRHHLPKDMSAAFDQAQAAFVQAQASIRSWVKPLYPMQAPAAASGTIICNAVRETGRTYNLPEPGGALLVDQRDMSVFSSMGFMPVPSGTAPANPRVGLVFMDTQLNEYQRWDGAKWAPVTLS